MKASDRLRRAQARDARNPPRQRKTVVMTPPEPVEPRILSVEEQQKVVQLCLLVTHEHQPLPDTIKVVQTFGQETIVNDLGVRVVRGDSCIVEAKQIDLVNWLKGSDGFWTTASPMMGKWHVEHISRNIQLAEA